MPMNVEYSVGPVELACKELGKAGTVRDKGKAVLLPWIVKLTEKLNRVPDQIETIVPAQVAVQVAAYGSWYDSTSKGHCGPVNMAFLPAEKHTYLVEFIWRGTSACGSKVFDVTDPTARVAVVAIPKVCPRSFMDIWLGR